LKGGIFTGPDIGTPLSVATFDSTMNATEKTAWQAFRDTVTKFLGNTKDPNYTNIIKKVLLDAFKDLGCSMGSELHFLHSRLDYFAENLGSLSEGEGEGLHTDVKEIERRCQGRWNINMPADCWWMLKPRSSRKCTQEKGAKTISQQESNGYSDRNDCSTLLQ
jgi:hypothetical protein